MLDAVRRIPAGMSCRVVVAAAEHEPRSRSGPPGWGNQGARKAASYVQHLEGRYDSTGVESSRFERCVDPVIGMTPASGMQ